jgi:predicted transcriptional regulator
MEFSRWLGITNSKENAMLVQEVMSTGVVTARRTDSVRSVVTKMLSRHCGAIPVV